MPLRTLTAADLELARQIGNRRGYLAQPFPAHRALSLTSWRRQRYAVHAELTALEAEAQSLHGTVAALLAAAGLGGGKAEGGRRKAEEISECLDDTAHGGPIPPQHCGCAQCMDTLARQRRTA